MLCSEVSLVLSSKVPSDPEAIASVVPLRPFSVWRRKPNLVVHGVDTIPAMSWIYERQAEGDLASQSLTESSLREIASCAHKIREAVSTFGLRGTVICRLASADESSCVEIPPDLLSAIALCGCTLQFAADRD